MSTPSEQVQQAPSVRIPKRFPLVARPGFRSTTVSPVDVTARSPVTDAALFNAYAEFDPEDNQYWVQKRLGNATLATQVGTGGGCGVGYFGGSLTPIIPLAIFGTSLYFWSGTTLINWSYSGTHSAPIVPGRAANFLNLTIPPIGPTMIWCANGGLWLISAAGHYENIIDFASSVPWTVGLCDGCVNLDTVTYVMDFNGNIWGSNSNTLSTWAATTVIQAGGPNDQPVCLVQQLEYIIALKSTSLRCFYDAGAAANTSGVGSNLAWVEGADANFGCANAGSVQLIDQTLIWVTNNVKNTPQIAKMEGLQVQIISTPQIERLLQKLTMGKFSASPNSTTNVLYSNGIKRGGHRFYILTVPPSASTAAPFTLVYDLDQQLWYVWTGNGTSYWPVIGATAHADTDTSGSGTTPGVFAQDISSGAFYVVDIDQVYPTDSGIPAQVDIYTPNADMSTRRKKQLNAMYWVNDQVSGSKMQVRKSDDDYRSWSPFRDVSLSVPQPSLTRCGSFRRRALNLRHNASTPFRIKASDVQIDVGVL